MVIWERKLGDVWVNNFWIGTEVSLGLESTDLVSRNYLIKSQLEPLVVWEGKDIGKDMTKVYKVINYTVEWNRGKVEKEIAKVYDAVWKVRVKI